MKIKLMFMVAVITIIIFLFPLSAGAVTVDGTVYDKAMWCAMVTNGFGSYNNIKAYNDDGHTVNLVGECVALPSYGYWYNSVLGYDKSLQYGVGSYPNGGNSGNVLMSTYQINNYNTAAGYRGDIRSNLRGLNCYEDGTYLGPNWKAGHTKLVVFWSLPKNSVYAGISGLDSADQDGARVTITGTGLPNKTSYGSSETYSGSGTTSFSDTVRYGSYYVSVYIPNASKYNITYSVSYKRGDRYNGNYDNADYYNFSGSGSFSTNSYYLESTGYLSVSISCSKAQGVIVADMYKGTRVTESYENKIFYLYNSAGAYLASSLTNTSGYAYFYNLPYGTYRVDSSTPPQNHYWSPSSNTVTVNSSSYFYSKFTLYKNVGNLKVVLSTEDNLSKDNVPFNITSPNGTKTTYYTNASGEIILNDITTGAYQIEQAQAPPDYERLMDIVTATVTAGATTTATFYNPILYNLSVELSCPVTAIQMVDIPVTVTYYNNGGKNISDVPICLEWGGAIVPFSNINISIPAHSSIAQSFTIRCATMGNITLIATINDNQLKRESDYTDNTVTKTINITTATNLKIVFISPNSEYREGTQIMATFKIINEGYNHITPTEHLSVQLIAYYFQNSTVKYIFPTTANQLIIPAGGDNLVSYKLSLPYGLSGCKLNYLATVNQYNNIIETNTTDNSITLYKTIQASPSSTTPDTQFERSTPSDFVKTTAPFVSSYQYMTWSCWEWVNGWFEKKNYGLQLSPISMPSIVPDVNSPSRKFENGGWTMRSGYGFTLSWTIQYVTPIGYATPSSTFYTGPQRANMYFPEFMFSTAGGKYKTLKWSGTNSFTFPNNLLHYTPLWFPNGNYMCQGQVYDIWTPAGMLSGNANTVMPINISQSAYDDWFIN